MNSDSLKGLFRRVFSEFRFMLKGNVGIMAISWFLFSLSGALVQPFFTLYAKSLGADEFSIALVKSAGLLALSIALIPGGLLTDYIGRVKMIVAGTIGITVIQFLYALADSWRFLALIWILDELLHFYQPALSAIVMDSLPKDKTLKGFIILQVFPNLPWLFMPLVGGYLYDTYGLIGIRAGFILSGIISAIVTILRIKGFKETYSYRQNNSSPRNIVYNLVKNRNKVFNALRVYVYTALLFPIATGVSSTYSSIYVVDELGMSKVDLGEITSFSIALSIAFSSIFSTFKNVDKHLRELGVLGSLSVALSQAALGLAGKTATNFVFLAALSFVLSQVGSTLTGPVISATLTRIIPIELRGTMTGIQRTLETLGSSLGSFIAGVLYIVLGPSDSLLISSLLGLTATYYLLMLL
ncbi:MAG: MFS transporter, partial [Zestosphaera sp.]